jgi:hypothetical protein
LSKKQNQKLKQISWKSIHTACKKGHVFSAQPRGKDAFIIICDIPESAMECVDSGPSDVVINTQKRYIKIYRNSQITIYLSRYDYVADVLLTYDGRVLSAVSVCAGGIKSVKVSMGDQDNYSNINLNI